MKCDIERCNKKANARGLCHTHYCQEREKGTLEKWSLKQKQEQHGLSKIPEYRVWHSMKMRCYNKNLKQYKNYGGRGISICDRWKNSFSNFIEDVGRKPFKEAEIDRIDNDGNYGPDNCRWTDRKTNCRNTRISLNHELVQQVKELYSKGGYTTRSLGKKLSVSKTSVWCIINKTRWA